MSLMTSTVDQLLTYWILKESSTSDNNSDDDAPLVNLIAKQRKPAKSDAKTTKRAAVTQGSASRKREGIVACSIWFHVLSVLVSNKLTKVRIKHL